MNGPGIRFLLAGLLLSGVATQIVAQDSQKLETENITSEDMDTAEVSAAGDQCSCTPESEAACCWTDKGRTQCTVTEDSQDALISGLKELGPSAISREMITNQLSEGGNETVDWAVDEEEGEEAISTPAGLTVRVAWSRRYIWWYRYIDCCCPTTYYWWRPRWFWDSTGYWYVVHLNYWGYYQWWRNSYCHPLVRHCCCRQLYQWRRFLVTRWSQWPWGTTVWRWFYVPAGCVKYDCG
uniref:Putative nitrate reductase n=1 Tax=Pectinaria gouldii TaxID=260746 RepID=A0A0K1R090_PECGU|nr:putative nitrate reductase [Pectinaria gouldii]